MKAAIRWATQNSPAMNTLMVAVMFVGFVSMFLMRREVFPEFDLEIVLISVPYPGASPSEVEEGICQKLEEAVRSINGIKKQTAVAQEGGGHLVLELENNVSNVQKILSDIRSEVDRIPSFPELAEDPEVQQITLRQVAIRVGLLGPNIKTPDSELALREVAERVRTELLLLPTVSQANLIGVRDYQIDIEVSEDTLRKYGLTLQQVGQIIRRENIEIPGGSMKTESQEVLLRGKNKRLLGEEIANIPLVTTPDGVVLTVGEIGNVKDEFTDDSAINLINGRPGLVISIDRTATEDLLAIVDDVHAYVDSTELPPGYELTTWQDSGVDVRDRINLLRRNGIQGLILVFLVLAVFLDLRLAFWVALGIPISVLGACAMLLYVGATLNMISLFAFLLALGIVVDDAIVIGENIYAHRQQGKDYATAAVEGAHEVLPSVSASVTTTIIAFVPLFYVSGVMGKFIAVLPLAVIAMLAISLAESTFILPCHLAHRDNLFITVLSYLLYPFRLLGWLIHVVQGFVARALEFVIQRIYMPALHWATANPAIMLSSAFSIFVVTLAFVPAGITPWLIFPKLDSNWIEAKVTFPDGTPSTVTDLATRQIEEAFNRINDEWSAKGMPLKRLVHRAVGQVVAPGALGPDSRTDGSHVGMVFIELQDTSTRDITSEEILSEWRRETGELAGVDTLIFGTPEMGPGGAPIEFKLLAPTEHMSELEAAVEACKTELADAARYPGVVDIRDDSRPGKLEYQLNVKESALAMGITAGDLAETVRATYYGEEVMRLQRGRHEVKLMVRYPEADRRSLAGFDDIRVRGSDGAERPLTELADVRVQRGYSEINRVDQLRSITITGDIKEKEGNARESVARFRAEFEPKLAAQFPNVRVRWEGQAEQSSDSMRSLFLGFIVALLAMYVLLTMEFRSYFQPLVVLAIIPFGLVGALWGHAALGLPLTMFSLFGLVALAGVVVNDSIVLMDFINHEIKAGARVQEAIIAAGTRRFRPVVLTSLTTVAGLTPILLETSFQAQVLIPMAASLCFGLILGTVLVLFLVPVVFSLYGRMILGASFNRPIDEVLPMLSESVVAQPVIAEPSDEKDQEAVCP
ncbi:MAG: efflux RND transporter permease subunit [Planctomycetaceae bacterium]|nr:efflux RND transporter permease subunit [Planctomycetales bacterium]MCB9921469.1 efflux RND transporter permease subunit [Planctomycetaceae bacterium]